MDSGRRPRVLDISSRENAHFKTFRSLLTAKGIKAEGLCLVSGRKIIEDLLLRGNIEAVAEIVSANAEPMTELPKIYRLSADLMRELDEVGTHGSILLVRPPELKSWSPDESVEGVEVFLPVGDPLNLGAAVRSSVGLGASRIVLCAEAANPFLPKSIKSSAGAVFATDLYRAPSLQDLHHEMIALDSQGEDLDHFQWPKHSRLLVGEEGQGIPKAGNLKKIRIPTAGVESLNATVALSIALYQARIRS